MSKTCQNCGRTFSTNANYNYHINRKKPCVVLFESYIEKTKIKFQCNRCDCLFTTKSRLQYHLKRKFPCKLKNQQPEEIELRALFEQLKNEHEQSQIKLQDEIKMLKDILQNKSTDKHSEQLKIENENLKLKYKLLKVQNKQPINNTTNNTISNNINNNKITINMYGNETLTHLTDDFFKSCFEKVKGSVEKLFERKHFSLNMQRNHNVYISNMRDNHLMIYEDGQWNIANKEITLNKMYYDTKDNLSVAYDRMCKDKILILRLVNAFRWFVEDDIPEKEENVFKKISIDAMACMAYNNREYPMEIKKQMEERKKNKIIK